MTKFKDYFNNLNYFPMGFETKVEVIKESKDLIWTISLWDLKHLDETIYTYELEIWTISLWDLKHDAVKDMSKNITFELFPYGIWNMRMY